MERRGRRWGTWVVFQWYRLGCGVMAWGLSDMRLGWTQICGWQLWTGLGLDPLGVTGRHIKAGVLINCATRPPAALNMLRPGSQVTNRV
ncbi:hypothetical protein DPEC_G00125310 [Dallia pectoralis]|uniref:Uncharacterized protein n=1 Tax=Dallia pectoralis TaxID=75939 RepID=A0ACC2GRR4_DALPE|nr:hypothetical protein DPEC_G00125310 [Dallia pectoralis]